MLWVVVLVFCATGAYAQSTPAETALAQALELRDSGRKVEALHAFRKAATLQPDLPYVHREIGLILLDQRNFADAALAFRTAVRRDPNDLDSRYNLALCLANSGRRSEGVKELRSLIEQRPEWAQPWFGLGHIYEKQGRNAEAEKAFRKALELDPKLFRAQFELGRLLDEKGDREGAIKAFSAGVRIAPDSPSARFRLATLLQQTGRREEAAQEFRAVRELRNNRGRGEQAALAYRQGLAYLDKEDAPSAIREFKRGLELRPDFPELRAALATAYEQHGLHLEQKGDTTTAIQHYRLALEFAPSPETENHVGVLLAKSGRLEEAIACFQRAIELKPDYQSAQTNLQQATRLKDSVR